MRWVSKGSAVAVGLSGAVASLALGEPRGGGPQPPRPPAVISNYGESETARSAAMGGALRAIGSGSPSIFLNPAAMAEAPAYHIEGLTDYTFETRRWMLGAVVVDSVTSRLAGSFSIQGTPIAMDPDGINRSQLDLRLGVAYPITDKFILGVTGRYFKVTQSGLAGPSYGFGQSVASGGLYDPTSGTPPTSRDALVNTFTFDVGLVAKPSDAVYIGIVGQNLTYAQNGFLPLLVGGGFGYSANDFSVEADGLADLSSWSLPGALKPTARIMGGGEYLISGVVPVRAGVRYDQGAKLTTLSLGSGYVGTSFAVEAALKRTVSNPGETSLFLTVAYYLESTGLTKPSPSAEPTQ